MMRRPAALFIAVAVVAALIAGIAALSLWPESPPQTSPPPPQPSPELGELIRETPENVPGVSFYPSGGTPYTVSHNADSGDYALEAPETLFPGKESSLRLAYRAAISLTGLTRIAENADDAALALFGLDAPVMEWSVRLADGTSVDLMAGAQPAAGQGRYARRRDSREVFILSDSQASPLLQTLEDLYDISFFPSSLGDLEWDNIEYLTLEEADRTIELRKRSDEELTDALPGVFQYQILQPFVGEVTGEAAQAVLFDHILSIAPGGIEAAAPADLSVYGLDSPDRLTVTADGWTGTLLIGRRDAERGGRYVMIEGYDAVLFDPDGNYDFLGADPTRLRSQTVWLHNIVGVSSVTYELDGVTRVLRLEHNESEASLRGWLDDTELSESNARRLYMATLRISQNGGTDAAVPDGPPVYRITIRFSDGSAETLELYRLNDSQFLIVLGGENTGLFTNRMALQQGFLSRFELLDQGEDLPQM
ncbi:MAG: DUF4340 domain-containing protein [Oscillospiraceae bacterium]|nr:DUF4340 domain-containing protein [Oscillospiraceae bacterium]